MHRVNVIVCRLLVGVALVATGCKPSPTTTATTARPLSLVVSGDTAGWLMPCGCSSNQSGGLARRATFVGKLRQAEDVILADAGGAPGGTTEYQKLKFKTILNGEARMGVDVHNAGAAEAKLGTEFLARVSAETGVPIISANLLSADGKPTLTQFRIVKRGGKRVAITGVVSPQYASGGLRIADPRESVLACIQSITQTFDSLVVLAYLPDAELEALAAALPEADAIVGGPTGQSIVPRRVGAVRVAAATNKGKFLVVMPLGVKQTESDDPGSVVELDGKFGDDNGLLEVIRGYQAELSARDFVAADTGFVSQLTRFARINDPVAGSQACIACHKSDCASWQGSKHAAAWHTLETKQSHVDPYCQQCHTTGFGLPGGFVSARTSADRQSVGCENCHGPSTPHVRDPAIRTPFAAADQCVKCHDHENSPSFKYETYWAKITHGVATGAGAAAGTLP